MLKYILSFVILYQTEAISIERRFIITTASGPVKGRLNEFNGIEFYSYQGIPYAESPTGELRFKPPVPKKPWTYVLDATQEGAICSQLPKYHSYADTTEDCLILNVYVPRNGSGKLLPVMVFIHGGGLQYLSGHIDIVYGPQYLLKQVMIYVSMNYRLGPFGFLSLGVEEASGNAGLKDILLSLKWVKHNIRYFGGDPDKVTIAGHSSGSLIVNFLMLTNQSHGLFNQAIQIDGSAFTPRSFAKHSKDISFALAEQLGIETNDVYKTLESLHKIDAIKILRAYSDMAKTHDSPLRVYAPFVPSKEVESDHALFVMDPMEIVRKNNVKRQKVPILIGLSSQEAIFMTPYIFNKLTGVENIRENAEYLIPSDIEYPLGSQKSKKLAKLLGEMYFGENMQNFTLTSLIEFMSDTQYNYGIFFWMEEYRKMPDSKALYLYMFDFKGQLNRNQFYFNSNLTGIGHADDISYIFVSNITKYLYNHVDEKSSRMLDAMINYISNFVHYGNPTPEFLSNKILWPDYKRDRNYLLLNDNPTVETFSTSSIYSRMQFWDEVYNEYFEYLENGGEIQKKIIP